MQIFIDDKITIIRPSEQFAKWIERTYTIPNPEYEKKLRMGFWVSGTPEYLRIFTKIKDGYLLPYGCHDDLCKYLVGYMPVHGFSYHDTVDFGGNVPLYDYQDTAKVAMQRIGHGILQSAPGSGKTQIGLALAEHHSTPTLWITHTKELLKQSYDRAAMYFDKSKFGKITEGKMNIGETITFATIQTLVNCDLEMLRDTFDVIICDECHRIAGSPTRMTQYFKVLNNLSARHKYGLSATVHRSDGLIKMTYSLLGHVAYTVPDEAIADKVMDVTVVPVWLATDLSDDAFNPDGTVNYTAMIGDLCANEERNQMILQNLFECGGNYNLVLSDRLNQLEWFYQRLPDARFINGAMVSKKGKKQREQAIEDMREGKARYLLATYNLAKEGLDIPRLDRLHLLTPHKDYAVVTQAVGRIARTFEGKDKPIVYDYVDKTPICEVSFRKRKTIYRKGRCNIADRK